MARPFDDALRQARLSEAAHLDAVIQVEGSKALRLAALKDKLSEALLETPEAGKHMELRLAPGETPRLWIDLLNSVVMEPDPGSYRLERDHAQSRELLFESRNADHLVQHVLKQVAHRALAGERAQRPPPASDATTPPVSEAVVIPVVEPAGSSASRGRNFAAMAYVWMTGFIFGAAALVFLAIYLEKLHF